MRYAAIFFAAMVSQVASRAGGVELGKPQVPRGALEAWNSLENENSIARLTIAGELRGGDSPNAVRYQTTFKARRDNRVLISERHEEGRVKSKVWGRNERYVFSLERTDPDSPWVVTHLAMTEDGPASEGPLRILEVNEKGVRTIPLQISHFSLGALCRHSSFEVAQASQQASGLFELRFRVDPKGEALRMMFLCSGGRLLLDPSKSWLPLEYELHYPGTDSVLAGRFSDFRLHDGVWLPFAFSTETRKGDGTVIPIGSGTLQEVGIRESIPEREFTLSAFGLPEPGGVNTGVPAWIWLTGVIVLFVAAGALVRSRHKGRRANPS